VSLFRRQEEPLHERLLREAGLDVDYTPSPPPAADASLAASPPTYGPSDGALHGAQRPREWDAVVTASAPGLRGDGLDFVVVEDGSVLMEHALPQGSVEPLCEAIEGKLRPPYRAHAVRKDEALWAVSARRLKLVELSVAGDELELTVTRTGRKLVVDGRERLDPIPELELGAGLPAEFHAAATRIQGDRWELDVVPL
jgi:hypothetical protein